MSDFCYECGEKDCCVSLDCDDDGCCGKLCEKFTKCCCDKCAPDISQEKYRLTKSTFNVIGFLVGISLIFFGIYREIKKTAIIPEYEKVNTIDNVNMM